MSLRRARSSSLLLLLTVVVAAACGGGQPIDTGDPGGNEVVYDNTFGNGAFDAMAKEDCGSATCHSASGQAGTGDLQLPDAAGTLTSGAAFAEIAAQNPMVVNTADDAASLLLTKGAGTGHGGGALWAAGDKTYEAVLSWIVAGAQNN